MKIALSPLERILRENGAERIGAGAVEELRKEVESYAKAVAEASIAVCKHAGRKTIRKEDVKLVVRL